jgi:hydrogenase maturation protease
LAKTGKLAVIGVGNLLLKDEGVGIHVVRELQKNGMPERVKILDGGLGGIGLLDLFQDAPKVLLVDAADMNLKTGAVVRFTPDEVRGRSSSRPRFSSHDLDLLDVLELARELKRCPAEMVIIGIQPGEVSWGTGLTPEVQASVPRAIAMILKEIGPSASLRS